MEILPGTLARRLHPNHATANLQLSAVETSRPPTLGRIPLARLLAGVRYHRAGWLHGSGQKREVAES